MRPRLTYVARRQSLGKLIDVLRSILRALVEAQ